MPSYLFSCSRVFGIIFKFATSEISGLAVCNLFDLSPNLLDIKIKPISTKTFCSFFHQLVAGHFRSIMYLFYEEKSIIKRSSNGLKICRYPISMGFYTVHVKCMFFFLFQLFKLNVII